MFTRKTVPGIKAEAIWGTGMTTGQSMRWEISFVIKVICSSFELHKQKFSEYLFWEIFEKLVVVFGE